MARKQNGGYNASISVLTPIFHLVVNSTRLKTVRSAHWCCPNSTMAPRLLGNVVKVTKLTSDFTINDRNLLLTVRRHFLLRNTMHVMRPRWWLCSRDRDRYRKRTSWDSGPRRIALLPAHLHGGMHGQLVNRCYHSVLPLFVEHCGQ